MPPLYEADLSAQQPPPQAHARLSCADAHPLRAGRDFGATPQGAQKTFGVISSRAVGETFSRDDRLRKRREFEECYASGVRASGRHLQMFLLARRAAAGPRLGVSVPRRAGNAVTRNRLRRRLREIFRRSRPRLPWPEISLVVNIRPGAASASFSELAADYQATLERAFARLGKKG